MVTFRISCGSGHNTPKFVTIGARDQGLEIKGQVASWGSIGMENRSDGRKFVLTGRPPDMTWTESGQMWPSWRKKGTRSTKRNVDHVQWDDSHKRILCGSGSVNKPNNQTDQTDELLRKLLEALTTAKPKTPPGRVPEAIMLDK